MGGAVTDGKGGDVVSKRCSALGTPPKVRDQLLSATWQAASHLLTSPKFGLRERAMFKTKLGRARGFGWLFATALDIVLAYLLASWFFSEDLWFGFLLLVGVLWLGPLFFAIKGSIYKTLLYFITRAGTRKTLVQEFRKAQLPLLSGTDFNEPADLYFQEVASDDTLPKEARIYANMLIGQMGIVPIYSSVDTITMHANLDAALAIYFDEMRRDGVRPHGQ
jgi:hypothetical protein